MISGILAFSVNAKSRTYPVYKMAQAPVLDGKMDSAWNSIPFAGGFLFLGTDRYALSQTLFKAGHDAKNLYIYVYCNEPDVGEIKSRVQNNSGIWKDNSIEFFCMTGDSERVCQFLVNTEAAKWTFFKALTDTSIKKFGLDEWQAASYKGNDFWTLEISIPFAALGKAPAAGEAWKVNLCRNVYGKKSGGVNHSSWTHSQVRFFEPQSFGNFVFKENVLDTNEAMKVEGKLNEHYIKYLKGRLSDLNKKIPALRKELDSAGSQSKDKNSVDNFNKILTKIGDVNKIKYPSLFILNSAYNQSSNVVNAINDFVGDTLMHNLFNQEDKKCKR